MTQIYKAGDFQAPRSPCNERCGLPVDPGLELAGNRKIIHWHPNDEDGHGKEFVENLRSIGDIGFNRVILWRPALKGSDVSWRKMHQGLGSEVAIDDLDAGMQPALVSNDLG